MTGIFNVILAIYSNSRNSGAGTKQQQHERNRKKQKETDENQWWKKKVLNAVKWLSHVNEMANFQLLDIETENPFAIDADEEVLCLI